jgi:hypothetical protein
MAKKNYLDFSLFDEVGDAMDLFANTIRNSFEYDSLAGKDVFRAVVLTIPIPMDISQIESFIPYSVTFDDVVNASFDENRARFAKLLTESDEIPKFTFKARILGPDSPHSFLPNPCNREVLKELRAQNKTQDIIDLHTTVIAASAQQTPEIGSIVEIKLNPVTYKYDLQTATLVGFVSSDSRVIRNLIGSSNSSCGQGAFAAFSDFSGKTVGSNMSDRGVSYLEHFDSAAPRLAKPAEGSITSLFNLNRPNIDDPKSGIKKRGKGTTHKHLGIDIANSEGSPIVAAYDGVVHNTKTNCPEPQKGENGGAGNYIEIKHTIAGKKYLTRYLHVLHTNSPLAVGGEVVFFTSGESVKQGETIALMGNTGGSTGPHLHFELRKGHQWNGTPLDPYMHFESFFDESIEKQIIEAETGELQASKESGPPPQEDSQTLQSSAKSGTKKEGDPTETSSQ